MIPSESVDVSVIGAGPAGCCAALRLLALGYRVALVERRAVPRSQIGESLSPGIRNILEYLGASDTIDKAGSLRNLPARVIWERRVPDLIPSQPFRPTMIVDRAEFDARLMTLAVNRGARLIQPARARWFDGEPGAWQILVTGPGQQVLLETRLILDARGRSGQNPRKCYPTAPTTIALWTHVAGNTMPHEMLIEALNLGWLWGAPLANGDYRAMAFLDPSTIKPNGGLDGLFRTLLAGSNLFEAVAQAAFRSPLRTCSATPCLDMEFWRPGYIKLGESALALDPLSSSGVEKSMRLALQAAIAANTMLRHPETAHLAKDFYESCLLESAAAHTVWTRGYYGQAWPGANHVFWRDRACGAPQRCGEPSEFVARLHEACAKRKQLEADPSRPSDAQQRYKRISTEGVCVLFQTPVALSPDVHFVNAPCVVNDCVELRPAITHPELERPLAFLAGYELVPLLQITLMAQSLGQIVAMWSSRMPVTTATHIAGWLRQHGLLETKRIG